MFLAAHLAIIREGWKGRVEVIPFLPAIKWLLDQFSGKRREGGKQIKRAIHD